MVRDKLGSRTASIKRIICYIDRTFDVLTQYNRKTCRTWEITDDRTPLTVRTTVVMSMSYYSVYTDITNELESKRSWKQPMWEPQQ